jgi:D-beta-D-heptose 7-phosphate kinase/D-beta-D-heptose 1-phosphate adenosyltransferase
MIELTFTRIGVDAVTSEHGDSLHPAVLTLEELILQFGPGKRNGKRVVFTNGCFDLLHPGHIKLLEAARSKGDALIVGLNSDKSVQALKGPGRPIVGREEVEAAGGEVVLIDVVEGYSTTEILRKIRV